MAETKIINFGCRLNALEGEMMSAQAQEAGVENTVFINSCAVTSEAVRQARQLVRRTARENPTARIIVTGCAAQIDPQSFAEMPQISHVIGNQEKHSRQIYQALAGAGPERDGLPEGVYVNDIMQAGAIREDQAADEPAFQKIPASRSRVAPVKPSNRARAYVQIQTGCDHRCTFCTIPFGRGNSRSFPPSIILKHIEERLAAGIQEIVLTGVDLTSYGRDLAGSMVLGDLVRQIFSHFSDNFRLRLSSLDSIEIDPPLLRVLEREERLLPYFHLSLQAGDDIILKRMKRRHLRADALRICAQLTSIRPDLAIGADLIAGFPTETDEMFERTAQMVSECGLTHLHVFPFSPRPDTPAARMPPVAKPVILARAARLRRIGQQQLTARLTKEIGQSRKMLVERPGSARTDHYFHAKIDSSQIGAVIYGRVTAADQKHLYATEVR